MIQPPDRTSPTEANSEPLSWASSPPERLRAAHAEEALSQEGPPPRGVLEAESPPSGGFRGGLLFTPAEARGDAMIVYFHGGGFVAGSPVTHRRLTAWLAQCAGLPVLSAAYRLTPEHRYPAQREDALAAIDAAWARLGRPDARLFLAGDSAGACVALWALRVLAPAMRERIAGTALLYGAFGLTDSPSIRKRGAPENGLDAETLTAMYARLGDLEALRQDPLFSPLRPDVQRIQGAIYVLAAMLDPIADDSRALLAHLATPTYAKVPSRGHGFLKPAGRDVVAAAELKRLGGWIKDRLD